MSSANVNPTSRETHNPSTQAAAAQASHLQTVVPRRIAKPFSLDDDETYSEPAIERKSTGVPFLDDALGGGHVAGDVHLVLGAYGGGKSTLAQQLTVACGDQLYRAWQEAGQVGPRPLAYLFSYEDHDTFIKTRMLAYTARVPFTTLRSPAQVFSTTGALKPYELEMFQSLLSTGDEVPGEQERLRAAKVQLNNSVRIVDLSGLGSTQVGIGGGLHDEVRAELESAMLVEDKEFGPIKPGVIIIDYVNAAVKKHLAAKGLAREHQRHLLNEYPLIFKTNVMNAFNCPGWVFGQYDTEGKNTTHRWLPTHMNSPEGKGIGEACDFCFDLGVATEDNLLMFSASKLKRTATRGPILLKHDLEYAFLAPAMGPGGVGNRLTRPFRNERLAGLPAPGGQPGGGLSTETTISPIELTVREAADETARLLADVAAEAREVYIENRRVFERRRTGHDSTYVPGPTWDGGLVNRGGRHTSRRPIWPSLAAKALERGFCIGDYIDFHFRNLNSGNDAPFPNVLCSDAWLDAYERATTRRFPKRR
jgi:hypothetical protein